MGAYEIDQYRQLHQNPKRFRGKTTLRHKQPIKDLIRKYHALDLLDFGCGKAVQYELYALNAYWGIMPYLYDPGLPQFSYLPTSGGGFDGVICCDVLEHIPEAEIPETLDKLFALSRKFLYLAVSTRPARKTLPDGRNCHLTVQEYVWWAKEVDLARARMNAHAVEVVLVTDDEDDV